MNRSLCFELSPKPSTSEGRWFTRRRAIDSGRFARSFPRKPGNLEKFPKTKTWAEGLKDDQLNLGGGFKHFLFSPLFGEDFQFDSYFSNGLKPPTRSVERIENDRP